MRPTNPLGGLCGSHKCALIGGSAVGKTGFSAPPLAQSTRRFVRPLQHWLQEALKLNNRRPANRPLAAPIAPVSLPR